ncbi:MAG: hypothetical protein JNK82_26290 [Myxococcaceae bacterium]|nr:hypothetical protein [Myxococcaceae bacterium]
MFAHVVSTLLAADPTVAIVVSRRVDVGAPVVAKVTAALEDALAAEQVNNVVGAAEAKKRMAASGVESSESCGNDRVCLIGLLHLLNVDVLVAVDVGRVVDQYVLRLSAIVPELPTPIAERATLVKLPKLGAVLAAETRTFARELKGTFTVVTPEPARAPNPASAPPPPPLIVVPAAQERPLPVRSIGLGATFAIAGVGALTALAAVIAGTVLKGQLDASYSPDRSSSSLSRTRAQSLANDSNGAFTVSLVSLVIAAASAAAGAGLWLIL